MSTSSGGSGEWFRGWLSRLARLPWRWHLATAGTLALAISSVFGGLNPVPVPDLPGVAEDQRYEGEPWTVTVNGVGTLTDASAFRLKPESDGDRWLVVSVTIEITADRSRADFDEAIRLRTVAGVRDGEPKQSFLRRDAPSPAFHLHPRLPEEVYLFWELAGNAQRPTEVEIEIIGMTYRQDSLTGHMDWKDPEPQAVVRAAVKDLDAT